jgi:uncharacterized protein (TIRG00374 family)
MVMARKGKSRNLYHFGIIIFRLIVTLGLFGFIFTKIDLFKTLHAVRLIGIWGFAGSTFLLLLNTTMIAPRWQKILTCYGVDLALYPLFRIAVEGYFFNQLLPTGIGGDAVRIWALRKQGVALNAATGSVIVDRLFGLATLFVFVAIGFPFITTESGEHDLLSPFLIVFALAIAVALGFVAALKLSGRPGVMRHLQFIFDFAHELKAMLLTPSVALPCLLYSTIGNLFPIVAVAWIAGPLGTSLNLADYFEIVPAALLIAVLPVSIGGWGVREAAMVVCMAAKGIPADTAVIISVVFGISMTVSALPGGALWLTRWLGSPGVLRPHKN